MPTKLKNLKVKRVAFVDEGANPDAHIRFAKRKDGEPEPVESEMTAVEAESLAKRFFSAVIKALTGNGGETIEKDAHTFDEVDANRKAEIVLCNEFYPMLSSFSDSVHSILHDVEKTGVDKKAMLEQTLSEFSEAFSAAASSWAEGDLSKAVVLKSLDAVVATRDRLSEMIEKANEEEPGEPTPNETGDANPEPDDAPAGDMPPTDQKGAIDMKFNVDAMTAEERAQYEDLAKRFGTEDETNPAPTPDPAPAGESGQEPTEADDMYKGLNPAVKAEIEALRKYRQQAEDKEIMEVAKRYTLLGKKPEDLAPVLKSLKAAGGTAYDDMIAVLDASLKTVEESGAFSEIGKRGTSTNGTDAWEKIETAAGEIIKSKQGMTWADAIDKACIQHPELVAEYEKSRR